MKHLWESHGHNKHKPGKSPAFAPQLPALPTLLAVTQPCCTSNVRNSRGSSIPPSPDPLPGTPQQLLHPRVALRCNGEKPGSCSGQHKPELAQRTKILLWLTSNGSHISALQKLQPSVRSPFCGCLRRHLRAQRNGQVPFISTKNLAGFGLTVCL